MSRKKQGGHEAGGRVGGQARPHPRGPLMAPLTDLLCLYIPPYPENIQEHHEKLFPPLQPSVSTRSHLGAFVGTPPEGESTTEGLYIISKASPMSCEQFTIGLWVHSYQLDGFFSLFESQQKLLLDLLGDLFAVTLFAVCLSGSDELWFMIKFIYEKYLNLL